MLAASRTGATARSGASSMKPLVTKTVRRPFPWARVAIRRAYSVPDRRFGVGAGYGGAARLNGRGDDLLGGDRTSGDPLLVAGHLRDVGVLAVAAAHVAADRGHREDRRPRQEVEQRLFLDRVDRGRDQAPVHQRHQRAAVVAAHPADAALPLADQAAVRAQETAGRGVAGGFPEGGFMHVVGPCPGGAARRSGEQGVDQRGVLLGDHLALHLEGVGQFIADLERLGQQGHPADPLERAEAVGRR